MACGKKLDGPEMPYDGLCSGPDDPGNSTECDEHEFKSCMTGVISKRSSILNKNLAHVIEQPNFRIPNPQYLVYLLDQTVGQDILQFIY